MFEGLFEAAPDATLLVNDEGRIVRLNRQAELMFGYDRAELLGRPVEVLLPTRFRGRHAKHRASFYTEPRTRLMGAGLQLFGRRRDGSEFPVAVMLSPLQTEAAMFVISVVRDITERVQSEEALRRQKEFSDRLINSSLDGIFAFDRECRYTHWNPAMERITGVARAKTLGQCAFDVFPFLVEIGEDKYFYESLAGRASIARNRPYTVPETGRAGFFEGYYSPIRDEAGEVVGGLAIIRDITERKQVEEALQGSEARFRAIFEKAAIGIALLDLEGKVVDSNPAWQRMLGYSADELRGMPFSEYTHPADLKVNMLLVQELAAGTRDHFRLEKRYLRKDRQMVWGNVTVSLVRDADGKPQFMIGMVMDITERKQMEAELAEVQRRLMEGREAERLHLAQELHDGPLQDLIGISYRLAELAEGLPDEAGVGQMVAAQATLQQVLRMLRAISGELRPPALAPFGLEKAIRSHAEDFQRQHPELKIRFELMPDGQALPEQVRLALFRIYQQALNNVVRHAQASLVSIRFELDAQQTRLEIQDDGRGFEVPKRWIELVRRGHLGLVGIVERAEAIGGRLEVVSTPGEGSLVRVIVPRLDGKETGDLPGPWTW
jgi:PAS domain S-box-containing protein